jgi:hypothetical protein
MLSMRILNGGSPVAMDELAEIREVKGNVSLDRRHEQDQLPVAMVT